LEAVTIQSGGSSAYDSRQMSVGEVIVGQPGSVGVAHTRFVDLPDSITKYAFVYVAPTLIVDVPIEFEIQSVPVGRK
jgi:hypothetical protein